MALERFGSKLVGNHHSREAGPLTSKNGRAAGPRPLLGLLKLARPWHWVKNVFVLLPLPFALASGAAFEVLPFLLGLLGFCFVNSAVYACNDTIDAAADRLHPKKRARPVANGDVSGPLALSAGGLFLAGGLALCWLAGRPPALGLTLIYAALSFAYCLGGKHVPLLDIFLISAGFVIRVLLGCFLLMVPPSNWLLLCSSALALFLGCAKRRADLSAGLDPAHRPSLTGYNYAFLDQMLGITATVTLLAYCLYSLGSPLLLPGRQLASVPFVAYGIFHYLRVVYTQEAGGSPVAMLYTSWTLQICGAAWFVTVMWSVGIW
jgi:4-hydroxybenzoate polyprenyltransferase